jgi:hypothetical protein
VYVVCPPHSWHAVCFSSLAKVYVPLLGGCAQDRPLTSAICGRSPSRSRKLNRDAALPESEVEPVSPLWTAGSLVFSAYERDKYNGHTVYRQTSGEV